MSLSHHFSVAFFKGWGCGNDLYRTCIHVAKRYELLISQVDVYSIRMSEG